MAQLANAPTFSGTRAEAMLLHETVLKGKRGTSLNPEP